MLFVSFMSEELEEICRRRQGRLEGHSCGKIARLWPTVVASCRVMMRHPEPGTVIGNSQRHAAWPTAADDGFRE